MAGQIAELAHRTLSRDFRAIKHATTPGSSCSTRRRRCCRRSAHKLGEKTKRELEKLGVEVDARRDGHRRRRARHRDEVQGRPGRAHRGRHQDLGRRRAGQPARPDARPSRPVRRSTAPAGSRVNPDLTLPGHPEVFVVGDMIALDNLPGVAQVAIQGAKYAAKEIDGRLERQAAAGAVQVLRQGLDGDHQPVQRGRDGRQAAAHRRDRLADVARASTSSTSPASRTGSPRCCTGSSPSSAAAAPSGPPPSSRSSPAPRWPGSSAAPPTWSRAPVPTTRRGR